MRSITTISEATGRELKAQIASLEWVIREGQQSDLMKLLVDQEQRISRLEDDNAVLQRSLKDVAVLQFVNTGASRQGSVERQSKRKLISHQLNALATEVDAAVQNCELLESVRILDDDAVMSEASAEQLLWFLRKIEATQNLRATFQTLTRKPAAANAT